MTDFRVNTSDDFAEAAKVLLAYPSPLNDPLLGSADRFVPFGSWEKLKVLWESGGWLLPLHGLGFCVRWHIGLHMFGRDCRGSLFSLPYRHDIAHTPPIIDSSENLGKRDNRVRVPQHMRESPIRKSSFWNESYYRNLEPEKVTRHAACMSGLSPLLDLSHRHACMHMYTERHNRQQPLMPVCVCMPINRTPR